ncbi:MAG: hypothetical protein M3188_07255 [Actinomycetota bacterium]|nr:hypothetical protein [Actinomycetota bacterium]
MGLLDWLRGGAKNTPRDTQEERLDIQRDEPDAVPATPTDVESSIEQRRDDEAARHSGI